MIQHQNFWTLEEEKEILKLYKKNITPLEIGEKVNRSAGAVLDRLKKILNPDEFINKRKLKEKKTFHRLIIDAVNPVTVEQI